MILWDKYLYHALWEQDQCLVNSWWQAALKLADQPRGAAERETRQKYVIFKNISGQTHMHRIGIQENLSESLAQLWL